MWLVAGSSYRCAGPEEGAGPWVVSLVLSLVSECPQPVSDWSERTVFRVGRWGSRLAAPRYKRVSVDTTLALEASPPRQPFHNAGSTLASTLASKEF